MVDLKPPRHTPNLPMAVMDSDIIRSQRPRERAVSQIDRRRATTTSSPLPSEKSGHTARPFDGSAPQRDAGDRHVNFDERGWETGRCRMA